MKAARTKGLLFVFSQNEEVKIHNGEDLILGDLVQLVIPPFSFSNATGAKVRYLRCFSTLCWDLSEHCPFVIFAMDCES
jgi:hypothetical protein